VTNALPPLPPGEGRGEGAKNADAPITNHQSPITNPPSISGSIKVASGPWSLEESWWSQTPADRDYWDVELSDGALYRIYQDRATGVWFADGLYD
jgi:protein ImuB